MKTQKANESQHWRLRAIQIPMALLVVVVCLLPACHKQKPSPLPEAWQDHMLWIGIEQRSDGGHSYCGSGLNLRESMETGGRSGFGRFYIDETCKVLEIKEDGVDLSVRLEYKEGKETVDVYEDTFFVPYAERYSCKPFTNSPCMLIAEFKKDTMPTGGAPDLVAMALLCMVALLVVALVAPRLWRRAKKRREEMKNQPPRTANGLSKISLFAGVMPILFLLLSFGLFIADTAIPGNVRSGVFRLLPFVCNLFSPVAMVLGILSLRQIRRTEHGQKGKGRAIFGIVVGAIWITALGIYLSPPFRRSNETAKKHACYSNLMMIDAAKEQAVMTEGLEYANLFNAESMEPLTDEQLSQFMKGGLSDMKCRAGGRYRVGLPGTEPVCSVHADLHYDDKTLACAMGDIDALRKLMSKGDRYYGGDYFMDKWSPLHAAAFAGHAEIVELLLTEGTNLFGWVDVNARTRIGETPLDVATDSNVIRILKKHGGKRIFSVHKERPKDVAKTRQAVSLVMHSEKTGPTTYTFGCDIRNNSTSRVEIVLLKSIVRDVMKGGYDSIAECASRRPSGWLCADDTTIDLEPGAKHSFNWHMEYTVDGGINGDKVTWRGVRSKIWGDWKDSGYSSGSPAPSYKLKDVQIAAWAHVRVEMPDMETIELPIWSEPLSYMVEKK